MNIAKKSTTKNGKILNGTVGTNNSNTDAIYIMEDDAQPSGSNGSHVAPLQEGTMVNAVSENVDDVIICNVEPPRGMSPNVNAINVNPCSSSNTSVAPNISLKRILEPSPVPQMRYKKLKPNISSCDSTPNTNIQVGPKMILLSVERLDALIKEAIKEELDAQQKEIQLRYTKEVQDLRTTLDTWRRTAQKLHSEIIRLKNKAKNADTSANSTPVKESPCNLPPASANPVTSQHLKILHLANTAAGPSAKQPQPAPLVGAGEPSSTSFPPSTVVIQPRKVHPIGKQGGVIDLTDEGDAFKTRINSLDQTKESNPPSQASASAAVATKDPNQVEKRPNIPSPPLPPASQLAPPTAKDLPPKPIMSLTINDDGVHLTWDCVMNESHEEAASYHLFSYQSMKDAPDKFLWKRVGNMEAMPLPMVCSLEKSKLDRQAAFAIRGVDRHCRLGPFSDVIVLNKEKIT